MIRKSAYSKEFIAFLKREDAYDAFMDLLSKCQFDGMDITTFFIKTSPGRWVENSFCWEEDEETGIDWGEISDHWHRIVLNIKER